MRPAVLVFGLAALACAVAHVAIIVSVVRRASRVADEHVPRPRLGVEIVWALIPAVALALVLTATWERVREADQPRPTEIMRVAQ